MVRAAPPELLERGVGVCERSGYAVARSDDGAEPEALAEPTPATTAVVPDAPGPVAVEPLAAPEVTPTTLLSRLWNAVERNRGALFVVPTDAADRALSVLRDPPFVAAAEAGRRRFYNGPDRVALAAGGYALARPGGRYRWAEEPPRDRDRERSGPESSEPAPSGDRRDDTPPRLVLRAGNGPVATLRGVAALDRPSAGSFPFSYRRGPEKRLRVHGADGRRVGTFAGVSALRDAGFEPVPMPLVPEHLFGAADARDTWGVLVADGGSAVVHTARGSERR